MYLKPRWEYRLTKRRQRERKKIKRRRQGEAQVESKMAAVGCCVAVMFITSFSSFSSFSLPPSPWPKGGGRETGRGDAWEMLWCPLHWFCDSNQRIVKNLHAAMGHARARKGKGATAGMNEFEKRLGVNRVGKSSQEKPIIIIGASHWLSFLSRDRHHTTTNITK